MRNRTVLVRAKLFRGVFPNDVFFVIDYHDGTQHIGFVYRDYCYAKDQEHIKIPYDEWPESGIDGLVIGVEFDTTQEGLKRVDMPNGSVYDLRPEDIEEVTHLRIAAQ